VWEKLVAVTYDQECVKRGWSRAGPISAMASIDAALYGIMAKLVTLPLYKFLGGYRDRVAVFVTGGHCREGSGIPELVDEVRGYLGRGSCRPRARPFLV
jgi:L-alanine-DL-glutamate epimerase-like enolase superfamily enzyme